MGGSTLAIIPEPPPPLAKTNLRCSSELLQDMDDIADLEGISRNDVMVHFLNWARDQYKQEKGIKDLRASGEGARKKRPKK